MRRNILALGVTITLVIMGLQLIKKKPLKKMLKRERTVWNRINIIPPHSPQFDDRFILLLLLFVYIYYYNSNNQLTTGIIIIIIILHCFTRLSSTAVMMKLMSPKCLKCACYQYYRLYTVLDSQITKQSSLFFFRFYSFSLVRPPVVSFFPWCVLFCCVLLLFIVQLIKLIINKSQPPHCYLSPLHIFNTITLYYKYHLVLPPSSSFYYYNLIKPSPRRWAGKEGPGPPPLSFPLLPHSIGTYLPPTFLACACFFLLVVVDYIIENNI